MSIGAYRTDDFREMIWQKMQVSFEKMYLKMSAIWPTMGRNQWYARGIKNGELYTRVFVIEIDS